MKKVLFIDRDGTLAKKPDDFQLDTIDTVSYTHLTLPTNTEV